MTTPTPHYYTNTASTGQIGAGGMTAGASSMPVNSATWSGYPTQYPYWVEVGQATASAEIMEVTGSTGANTFSVNRGQGGTTATQHNPGDSITHIIPAGMAQNAEAHQAATNAHGIPSGAAVVGTAGYQAVADKAVTGTLAYAYSSTNPPSVTAAVTVAADSNAAKDAVVVHNTAALPDNRAFALDQAGTPRVQVFMDGTVDVNPAGTTRPGLRNHGTTELDGATTLGGTVTASGAVALNGTTTAATLTAGTETVTGDLSLPLPASGTDTTPRIAVNANAGQPVLQGQLNGTTNVTIDSAGNETLAGNETVTGSGSWQAGKVTTYSTNGGHDVSVQGQYQQNTTFVSRDLRQPLAWGIRNLNLSTAVPGTDTTLWSVAFTPRESCEILVALTLLCFAGQGLSGQAYEPAQASFGIKVTSVDGNTTYYTGDAIYPLNTQGSPTWSRGGTGMVTVNDIIPAMTGGSTYLLVVHGSSPTALKPVLAHVKGFLLEGAFVNWLVNS